MDEIKQMPAEGELSEYDFCSGIELLVLSAWKISIFIAEESFLTACRSYMSKTAGFDMNVIIRGLICLLLCTHTLPSCSCSMIGLSIDKEMIFTFL